MREYNLFGTTVYDPFVPIERVNKIRAKRLIGGGGTFRDYLRENKCKLLKKKCGVELWNVMNEYYVLFKGRYATVYGAKAFSYFDNTVKKQTLSYLKGGLK